MSSLLHYIYDPLCGWCYAAESLIDAVRRQTQHQLPFALHAGGLFSRTRLPAAMRAHIKHADARIGELTWQTFGQAYLHGLLDDPNTVYDSVPPVTAILAADQVKPGSDLSMLAAIQHAHYRQGRRVVDLHVLVELAGSLGLATDAFEAAYEMASSKVDQHMAQSRDLMHRAQARGFPTFLLQTGNHFELLAHEAHYAAADGFAAYVLQKLKA